MGEPRISEDKEYEALRAELSIGKKFIFERPILIITAAMASVQLLRDEPEYAVYLGPIAIWLLIYNLWFTVNRLTSMARAVAYIQLVLENKNAKWYGWETSLKKYRKWLKSENIKIRNIEVEDELVYDNLGFYPVILWLHIAASWFAAISIIIYTYNSPQSESLAACVAVISVFILTGYSCNNLPADIRRGIEQNSIIWKDVFDNWDQI